MSKSVASLDKANDVKSQKLCYSRQIFKYNIIQWAKFWKLLKINMCSAGRLWRRKKTILIYFAEANYARWLLHFFLIKARLRIIIVLIKNIQYSFGVLYNVTEFYARCFIVENAEMLRDIFTAILRAATRSVNVFKKLEYVIYNRQLQ